MNAGGIITFVIILSVILANIAKNNSKDSRNRRKPDASAKEARHSQARRASMSEKAASTAKKNELKREERNNWADRQKRTESALPIFETDNKNTESPGKAMGSASTSGSRKSGGRVSGGTTPDNNRILNAAEKGVEKTASENGEDAKNNLMKEVYDLIAMGPDDRVPGRRDFLAEGMDMLNAYH